MLSSIDFLKVAQKYAEARGDEHWFCNYYTHYRINHSVRDSVYKTLVWMYGDRTAVLLEYQ